MDTDVVNVLKYYPQVYIACHVDHVRKRTNKYSLSSRDSAILAHLSQSKSIEANALARHIAVQPSTLSAALKRLQLLGYTERDAEPSDRRRKRLRLSARGEIAMIATSVLDPARVTELLERLSVPERARAVEGLSLLAQAARSLKADRKGKRR